jgi:hypothetical protein
LIQKITYRCLCFFFSSFAFVFSMNFFIPSHRFYTMWLKFSGFFFTWFKTYLLWFWGCFIMWINKVSFSRCFFYWTYKFFLCCFFWNKNLKIVNYTGFITKNKNKLNKKKNNKNIENQIIYPCLILHF